MTNISDQKETKGTERLKKKRIRNRTCDIHGLLTKDKTTYTHTDKNGKEYFKCTGCIKNRPLPVNKSIKKYKKHNNEKLFLDGTENKKGFELFFHISNLLKFTTTKR